MYAKYLRKTIRHVFVILYCAGVFCCNIACVVAVCLYRKTKYIYYDIIYIDITILGTRKSERKIQFFYDLQLQGLHYFLKIKYDWNETGNFYFL